jgi:hypothetical protein
MTIVRRFSIVAALAALGSCSDGPTTPGTPVAAVAISAVPTDGVLLLGANTTLSAQATSATGSPLSRRITWSSSATSVASVSSSGLVTGVAAGPVLIVASAGAAADTVVISVRVPVPTTPAGAAAPVTTSVLGGAVTLTVPPGASSATQLTVAPAAVVPDDDRVLASAVFDFGPSGSAFSAPVTMSLRYTPADVPAPKRSRLRIFRVEDDGALSLLPGGAVDEVNAHVTAPVSSFSTYAIVVPADIASLTLLEGNSQPGFVNTVIGGQTVVVRDAQGRGIPLVSVAFSVATGGGSLVGETSTLTDADGVATLPGSWLLGPTTGQQTLRATIVGDGRFVTFTAVVTAPATAVVIESTPSSGTSGVTLNPPLTVRVVDTFGDPVIQIGRTVTARLVEGNGTLQGDSIQDAPTGSAIFQNLRIAGSGPHRIAFVSSGLAPDTSAVIAVTQQVGQLVVQTLPAGAQSGVPFATQPVIELRDNAGLLMATSGDTVRASEVHGPGTPFGNLTAVSVNGVATFSGLAIEGAGEQSLRFAAGFVDVISAPFTVGPPPQGVWLRVGLAPIADFNANQSRGIGLQVDMSNAGGANVASITATVSWDTASFEYFGSTPLPWTDGSGASGTVTVDDSNAANGTLIVTASTPGATTASFTPMQLSLRARSVPATATSVIAAIVNAATNASASPVPVGVRPMTATVYPPQP